MNVVGRKYGQFGRRHLTGDDSDDTHGNGGEHSFGTVWEETPNAHNVFAIKTTRVIEPSHGVVIDGRVCLTFTLHRHSAYDDAPPHDSHDEQPKTNRRRLSGGDDHDEEEVEGSESKQETFEGLQTYYTEHHDDCINTEVNLIYHIASEFLDGSEKPFCICYQMNAVTPTTTKMLEVDSAYDGNIYVYGSWNETQQDESIYNMTEAGGDGEHSSHDDEDDGHENHRRNLRARRLQAAPGAPVAPANPNTGAPKPVLGKFVNGAWVPLQPTTFTLVGTKSEASWEPWVGALIVCLCTLIGVFFMLPLFNIAIKPAKPEAVNPGLAAAGLSSAGVSNAAPGDDLHLTANGAANGVAAKGAANGVAAVGIPAGGVNPDAADVDGDVVRGADIAVAGEASDAADISKAKKQPIVLNPIKILTEEEALRRVFSPEVIAYTSAFAAGALLSTAFMLILPEALHLIEDGGMFNDEAQVFWRWGTWLLFGFLTPWIVGVTINIVFFSGEKDVVRVAAAVLIGDAFHNLTDGIFLAAAFQSCEPAFGWTIVASTVAHEVTQEIADFFILTTVCGFSPLKALACNFCSGSFIFIGVIIVIVGNISDLWTGYLLVYGGGIYLYVGGTECFNRIIINASSLKMKLICFSLFAISATALGLVLLDHKHCVVDGHAH